MENRISIIIAKYLPSQMWPVMQADITQTTLNFRGGYGEAYKTPKMSFNSRIAGWAQLIRRFA